MLNLWYSDTTGRFAFYINATSTPTPKNGIRAQSRAFIGIGRHSRASDAGVLGMAYCDPLAQQLYLRCADARGDGV